jgi:hypothetical protein
MLTTIKVTALIAALGFVTVMLEQPRLTASPSHPGTSLEHRTHGANAADARLTISKASPGPSLYPTESADAPLNSKAEAAASGETPMPAPSSENAAVYFPGRFAPPGGEISSLPPTF